jgi:hypothetical protein
MEAVKQGSACVGLTSRTHVVLVALKRAPSELAAHQQKVFKVDEHMGIAFSGLTCDGRSLLTCVKCTKMGGSVCVGGGWGRGGGGWGGCWRVLFVGRIPLRGPSHSL